MESRQSGIVLGRIRTLFDEGRIGTMTDDQLLERFAARRAEAAEATDAAEVAFEVLVLRHGPMVLSVCRRVLRDPHEVEDAFQATFLILARRSGSIRKREVLGGWLRKVAQRVAARARELSVRRGAIEPIRPVSSVEDPGKIVEREDLCTAVLDEIQLLPEKYRLPVQFCYIEGQTHDEAARRLAWPVGTVRTRLTWARDRLRARLTRRGLVVPAGFIGASLASLKASTELPSTLVKATVETASGRAVGTAAITLATKVLRAMVMSQVKLAVLFVLVAGSVAGFAAALSGAQGGKVAAVFAGHAKGGRPAEPQAEVQKEPPAAREVGTVFFQVVDRKTTQPLSGVTLKVWINGKIDRQQITDDSGRMVIRLPEGDFERFTITARGDGYVPMRVYLRHVAAKETEVPRYYKLAMERGTSIGGIVRDEDGRPIEGVAVEFHETSPDDRGREALDFDGITARTDSQGRWHIDLIPAGLDLGHLHFTFSHPEFVSWIDAGNIQPSATPDQLRQQSGVIVLHRGVPIAGRVVNRGGRPIAGAAVRLGEHFWLPRTTTDAEGRFRIGNAGPQESFLSVQAAGYAPEMNPVIVRRGLPPIEFRLAAGRTIRGRVVDSRGQPIAGAGVYASQWRGKQNLDWRSVTDAEGQFRWENAPVDAVSIGAGKPGYGDVTISVRSSDNEQVITLAPDKTLRFRGSVTDAETGRPIETFDVVPGTQIHGPAPLWMVTFAKTHHGGRYRFSFDAHGTQPHMIRVEAKGYLPAVSPVHENDAGEQAFDARLTRGEWVEGVVRRLDGAPLSGAEVIVVTVNGIHISGGKTYQREYHPHLLTGADGRYSFSPPAGPYRLIALHDQGYAEAASQQLAELRGLTIAPWGRIEGTLRVGGKPLAHEIVIASLDEERIDSVLGVQNESRALTDENGRFVVERVTPGEANVHWQPKGPGRTTPDRYYQPAFVNVLPGQTAHVDLKQEGGRPLVGHVAGPDAAGHELDVSAANAYLLLKLPEVPYPPGLAEQDRREWLRHWRLTPDADEYRRRKRGFAHSLKLQPDGSFRIDEIQPGDYVLHVRVKGFAELILDVKVPEPSAGQAKAPIDLGIVALKR
jgi:RNA polymerase sigma factor (sigma-70 family)